MARSKKSHSKKRRSHQTHSKKKTSRKHKKTSRKTSRKSSRKTSRKSSRGGSSCEGTSGYCVKCQHKVKIVGGKIRSFKNGRKACAGKCPHCDTKVFRFVSSK